MRPVLHGDVVTAARALYARPPGQRTALAARLIEEADRADSFRRTSGRRHPVWGDGTLLSAAARCDLAPEPFLDEADYCDCMMIVFEALMERRTGAVPFIRRHS